MSSLINRDRLLSLFGEMINIYSPSGKEEELAEFLYNFLSGCGLPVRREPVDESRFNLFVGDAKDIQVLYLGHLDTVPAFDTESCEFRERDGICYGLGAADMKGGCAALIEAFLSAHDCCGLPDNVALALVVGEEETGDGTQRFLEGRNICNALVAEPTDLKVCLDHYGYIEMMVRVFGHRRHAAMSGRETNAIRAMLRFLLRVEERMDADETGGILNIRDLYSSESGFAVPARCAASLDIHIPPGCSAAGYAESINEFANQCLSSSRASRFEIEFPTVADGYRVNAGHPFAQNIMKVFCGMGLDWEPVPFKSHSDANLLKDAGCSPIILGPGQLSKAHTSDESVNFEQIVVAAELYRQLLSL